MRLDRHKFEAWLRTKAPDEIVGENRDCNSCPIALFYWETSGGDGVVIFDDGDRRRIDRGYSKRPLPEWADQFVWDIDGGERGKITARRALEVLTAQ